MVKKLYIPLAIFLIVSGAILLYLFYSRVPPLRVIATTPTSRASFSPFLPVTITFNREIRANEAEITVSPSASINIVQSGKTIQVIPQTKFNPKTQYTITIGTTPPFILVFITEDSIENSPGWNRLIDESVQQYEIQNATQAAALADVRTHAPIKEGGFTVSYSYANNTYTIALSPPYDQNKEIFLSWFAKKGVTNLTNLRLKYVNQ
jgi:hypothetical protein